MKHMYYTQVCIIHVCHRFSQAYNIIEVIIGVDWALGIKTLYYARSIQ